MKTCASFVMVMLLLVAAAAQAAEGGVKVGVLTCNVASGWGFVIGSTRAVNCTYAPADSHAPGERYAGTISKFGADIGYSSAAVMVWAVLAATSDLRPGSLAGEYGGATASVAAGVGAGANVLVGGSEKSIHLQPVSVEGTAGLNVAAGVESLTLRAAGAPRSRAHARAPHHSRSY